MGTAQPVSSGDSQGRAVLQDYLKIKIFAIFKISESPGCP
jgi:hypothetical protein